MNLSCRTVNRNGRCSAVLGTDVDVDLGADAPDVELDDEHAPRASRQQPATITRVAEPCMVRR
jgi:hypothetical protein